MRALAAAMLVLLAVAAGALAAADPERGAQWGLDMIRADQAHAISAGSGAIVAIVDTGVSEQHPELAGQVLPGHDFVEDDGSAQDENGHGTHVAGIVAALAGNGIGVGSAAPAAKILPVRVLDADGAGSAEDVKAGIDWAAAHGAHVINLSLGDEIPLRGFLGLRDEVDDAIDAALDRGIVVVAAAGNTSFPVCSTPAGRGRLLCVAAVDRAGQRTLYSNYGEGLSISAPGGGDLPLAGEGILSTWNDGGYEELAGTSQAVPHVAAAAALLVARGVRGQAAAQALIATATDAGDPGPDPGYGAGIVNAEAAVATTRSAGPPGAPGAGAARASIRVARTHRITSVLRRGLPVRCSAAESGSCRVRVVRRGRTLARGSRPLEAGATVTVRARPTAYGRRTLRNARRVTATVVARLSGAAPQSRRVLIKR